jgi:hypothetical protein
MASGKNDASSTGRDSSQQFLMKKDADLAAQRREDLYLDSMPLRTVNRVLVLYAALLTGMFGGHKLLLGARREAWLYIALSWTSITVLAALLDFIDLMRQPAVGRGFMQRRLVTRPVVERDLIEATTWRQLGRAALLLSVAVVVAMFFIHET